MGPEPSLPWPQQVELLTTRGLDIANVSACEAFLASQNYYRFSGYARYFQLAPHFGDNRFEPDATFETIRNIYDADEMLRAALSNHLARVELLLRTHTAHVIADEHSPYENYLRVGFYSDARNAEPTVESCMRDLERSRELHILHYKTRDGLVGSERFRELPVWSAVEAWSFGTLSRCIERGDTGSLATAVASSLGVAQAGFAYRVRALVYLRNRCAHHSRLWNHSVIDAGPTPNNVRSKAKRSAGQFEPRSVLDVIASLDDILVRGMGAEPILPSLISQHASHRAFWRGLGHPQNHRGRGETRP